MRSNNRMQILKEPLALVESAPSRPIPRDDNPHVSDIDDDTDLEEAEEKPAVSELQEIASDDLEAANHGPDDALGLYLRQMGAIPLLNRANEIEVAQRLERARGRFRVAALRCGFILRRALSMFEKIHAGQMAFDPNVDVISTLNLQREQILARLPQHTATLRKLLKQDDEDFAKGLLSIRRPKSRTGSIADWPEPRKCRV